MMKLLLLLFLSVAIGNPVIAAEDKFMEFAKTKTASFYGIPREAKIGTEAFAYALEKALQGRAGIVGLTQWLVANSDREDFRVGFLYLGNDVKVTLYFDHPDGLIVSQAEFRIIPKGIDAIGSAIRLLKGDFVPTEDIMLVEELNLETDIIPPPEKRR